MAKPRPPVARFKDPALDAAFGDVYARLPEETVTETVVRTIVTREVASARYLPLSGGALSGPLTAPALTVDALDGVLKASGGLVSGGATHADLAGIGPNDHHAQVHDLAGPDHAASGLTAGHVLRATGPSAFGFGAVEDPDLPATILRTSRAVNTSAPLTGGGALAGDLDLGLSLSANLKLTGGALDTVQPIGASALVQFGKLSLSGTLGGLVVNSGEVGSVLQAFLLGEETARFAVARDGALSWGAGGARDVNLYRGGAGLLKSDHTLRAAGLIAPSLAPVADAADAVQVLRADGLTPVLTVDTVNNWLGVNAGGPPGYPADVRQTLTDPTGTFTLLRAYQSAAFTANGGPTLRALQAQVVLDPAGFTLSSGANLAQAVYALVQITGAGTLSGFTANSAVMANLGAAEVQSAYMYRAGTPTNSGGGSIGTWVGYYVANVTQASTVYGIQSVINAAAGRWNLYVSGTAINHLAGSLLLGTTTDGMTAGGSLAVSQDLAHRGGKLGFYNATPAVKPAVAGSRGGNAALASLLTALVGLGLLTDSTTA